MGWSWDKIAHEMGAGLDTVHWDSAQACRVKRPHSGGAAPTHTARKTSVWRVCGSGLGRGREQRSGLNQRCIVTRAQSKGTNEWHTGEQDLIVLG